MSEFTKVELIAMRKNLGLGHKGDILLTTQKRVDENQLPIAQDVICEVFAMELVRRWNSQPAILQELKSINQCFKCKYGHRQKNLACPDDATGDLPCEEFIDFYPGFVGAEAAIAAAEEGE